METPGVMHARTNRTERRCNPLLRNRFSVALTLLRPLLSGPGSLSGTNLYRAMSQLQKTYPDLSGNEIEALVAAVVRSLQNRHKPGA